MMKTVPKKNTAFFSLCFPLCIVACLSVTTWTYASIPSGPSNNDTRYLVLVTKTQNNKKHNVRLYSSDRQDQLYFTVSGPEGKKYQLYVFDMDGKLVSLVKIHNKQTGALNRISKGSYFFEVFSDDEKVESGQLSVK